MNFKLVLQWVKSNPIAVGSAVICLASIVFLLIVRSKGAALVEEAQTRAQEIKKIEAFNVTPMSLPPEKVDAPARVYNAAVNQAAIEYLKQVFSQMQGDHAQIMQLAVRHNQGDQTRGMHLPFMEGLFPDPGFNEFIVYDARKLYPRIFQEMLGPATEGAQYPRLNAGSPVEPERINEVSLNVERNFRARYTLGEGALTFAQSRDLLREQRKAVVELLRQRARSIHLYVTGQPFQIDPWATNFTDKPQIEAIWESQMNLWVQQDIAQTIARTNRVSNPDASVIQAPIKRLNSIKIIPGYVGIDSGGGMSGRAGTGAVASGEAVLRDDFSIAPTGRTSNTIYDVRHVWVDMDVDIQQLPIFMDELVQTNFMSVLKMEMQNVNEYELLNQGYFMGSSDVVNIRMLIETLWLRSWITPLMPKNVKTRIGVPETPAPGQQAMAQ